MTSNASAMPFAYEPRRNRATEMNARKMRESVMRLGDITTTSSINIGSGNHVRRRVIVFTSHVPSARISCAGQEVAPGLNFERAGLRSVKMAANEGSAGFF